MQYIYTCFIIILFLMNYPGPMITHEIVDQWYEARTNLNSILSIAAGIIDLRELFTLYLAKQWARYSIRDLNVNLMSLGIHQLHPVVHISQFAGDCYTGCFVVNIWHWHR